jgi:hypothetical protein
MVGKVILRDGMDDGAAVVGDAFGEGEKEGEDEGAQNERHNRAGSREVAVALEMRAVLVVRGDEAVPAVWRAVQWRW